MAEAIRSEPLFLDEETLVFPVESDAALEEEGRGIVLERRGAAGTTAHQMLLLEARFDPRSLAARVMLAAARALPDLPPGVAFFVRGSVEPAAAHRSDRVRARGDLIPACTS